jgi:hypothetical protein
VSRRLRLHSIRASSETQQRFRESSTRAVETPVVFGTGEEAAEEVHDSDDELDVEVIPVGDGSPWYRRIWRKLQRYGERMRRSKNG